MRRLSQCGDHQSDPTVLRAPRTRAELQAGGQGARVHDADVAQQQRLALAHQDERQRVAGAQALRQHLRPQVRCSSASTLCTKPNPGQTSRLVRVQASPFLFPVRAAQRLAQGPQKLCLQPPPGAHSPAGSSTRARRRSTSATMALRPWLRNTSQAACQGGGCHPLMSLGYELASAPCGRPPGGGRRRRTRSRRSRARRRAAASPATATGRPPQCARGLQVAAGALSPPCAPHAALPRSNFPEEQPKAVLREMRVRAYAAPWVQPLPGPGSGARTWGLRGHKKHPPQHWSNELLISPTVMLPGRCRGRAPESSRSRERKGAVLPPPSARPGTKNAATSSRKLTSADTVGRCSRTCARPAWPRAGRADRTGVRRALVCTAAGESAPCGTVTAAHVRARRHQDGALCTSTARAGELEPGLLLQIRARLPAAAQRIEEP